ncbi:MAG: hypothetical protein ACREUG_04635, partial [Steroidobacteraceae bacterium]
IGELHRSWLRRINGGEGDARLGAGVRRITADHAGAPDRLVVAANGLSAVGHFHCVVDVEAPLAGDCTLVQMAHIQGTGTLCRTEHLMLTVDYTKTRGSWTIANIATAARRSRAA